MVLPLLAAQAAVTSIDALTGAVKGLKDRFDKAMEVADNAQKTSLSLGKTYEEVRKDLRNSIGGLRGSIENKLQVGFNLLNSGLDKNSAGVARLINQQQLTGTSFNNTAKTIAKLESSLGISRDSSNKLAENIMFLSAKFGISTDKLIDSISSLKDTFAAQRVLGFGANFQEAIALFVSRYGPAFAEDITNSVKYILEPGLERSVQLQQLGLGELRDYLENIGKTATPETLYRLLEAAIIRGGKNAADLISGSLVNLGIYESILGPFRSLLPFATAKPREPKEIEKETALSRFAQTIDTMRKETFNPLDEMLMDKLYPAYVKLYEIYSASINVFFRAFSDLMEIKTKGEELVQSDVFKKLKTSLLDAAENIALFGSKIFTFIIEGGFDLIIGMIDLAITGIQKTFSPGGYIDQFYVGMMGVVTDIKDSLDFGLEDAETTQAKRDQLQREIELAVAQGKVDVPNQQEMDLLKTYIQSLNKLAAQERDKRLLLDSFLDKKEYSLMEKFPEYVQAIEYGFEDKFVQAFEKAKAAKDAPFGQDIERLRKAMEESPMAAAIKSYFDHMRENEKAGLPLLDGIEKVTKALFKTMNMTDNRAALDSIDTNTANTAAATRDSADALATTPVIPTALQAAGNETLTSFLTTLNTANDYNFDDEIKKHLERIADATELNARLAREKRDNFLPARQKKP